jgi:plastocyanin
MSIRMRTRAWGRLVPVALLAGWMVAPVPAPAAVLSGRITLRPRPAPLQASVNPYAGSLGALSACCGSNGAPLDDVRHVVVSLPELTSPKPRSDAARPQILQVEQTFQPRVLAIPVGTTVEFPNRDPVFHNAFSYSKTKRFDLGKYGQGKSASVTFDKPGVVQIFCDIHANMSAWVYVAPSGHVVQPDASGDFVLRDVPAGSHTLEIWHPERGVIRRTVQVTEADGGRVEVDF